MGLRFFNTFYDDKNRICFKKMPVTDVKKYLTKHHPHLQQLRPADRLHQQQRTGAVDSRQLQARRQEQKRVAAQEGVI